jgi:cytochrome c-type biogenesis protein CcmH
MIAGASKVLLALSILIFAGQLAAKEPLIFMNPEQEVRYNELILELRCLVCQNQNLADSDAPLAQDLRKEIYDMMQAGRSNEEIKTFLVDRYGDFVLYKPPIKANTLALWLAPAVLLLLGGVVVVFIVRKRTRMFAEHKKESQ